MKRVLFFLFILIFMLSLCPAAIAADATDAAVTEVEVGIPIEERPELFLTRSMPTRGEGKIAVFLIEFPDQKNNDPKVTREYIDNVYFGNGNGEYWDAAPGTSVAAFYEEQSYGKLKLSGQVFDWYTAKHERSYYDKRKPQLIVEAIAYYNELGIDFSNFDGDGDGVIDAITFHFAGEYSDNGDDPWYSGTEYENRGKAFGDVDGVKFITMVQVAANLEDEQKLTGIICHELGHTLGLHDLYGTVKPGMNPTYDIMSHNARTINPYSKLVLGWLDTVRVITGDATNVVLEQYNQHSSDSVGIVCNEFKGFFDEFFMVALRKYPDNKETAAVWHIDARPNENGTAFRYNNLKCDPTPDERTAHSIDDYSPYAFIEELSGNPEKNFLLDFLAAEEASFLDGGIISPNSIPSSDTHDGEYTGIKMSHFVLRERSKEDTYVTFQVSFVQDNEAPTVVTQESELVFQEKITLSFNESIYAGERFADIQITDLNGNKLDATVKVAHYPRHCLKISFQNEAYKKGYRIVLPENSLADSSGNGIEAATLTAAPSFSIFPLSEYQVTPAGYTRNNAEAHFFTTENGFDVLTWLWGVRSAETNVDRRSVKLELMRFDDNGKVIDQIIIDNPIENGIIENVAKTKDGDYLVFCRKEVSGNISPNSVFCMDTEGRVRWVNEDLVGTELLFGNDSANGRYEKITTLDVDGGVVIKICNDENHENWFGRIDTETGELSTFENQFQGENLQAYKFYDIGNGQVLCSANLYERINGERYLPIYILDSNTLEVITKNYIDINDINHMIRDAYSVGDGTYLLFSSPTSSGSNYILLLDQALNTVKVLTLEKGHSNQISWFYDDGFVSVQIIVPANHCNGQYHVRRYNKSLELVWETDIEAIFFRFFKSSTGDLICYRSMWEPERECYIDYYGSDKSFNPAHTHNVVHFTEKAVTCANKGHGEFWQCIDCGVLFSDEGKTVMLDARGLYMMPLGGTCTYGEWKTVVPSTCDTLGERARACIACGNVVTEEIEKHTYGSWKTVLEPTCIKSGKKEKSCNICGAVASEELPCDEKLHDPVWDSSRGPTCQQDGVFLKLCSVCNKELDRTVIPASEQFHFKDGKWIVVVAPTCMEDGESVKICTVCNEVEVDRKTVPASGKYHVAGEWQVVKEPTVSEEGEEIQLCQVCGETATSRRIDMLSSPEDTTSARADDEQTTAADSAPTQSGCTGFVGTGFVAVFVAVISCTATTFAKKKRLD